MTQALQMQITDLAKALKAGSSGNDLAVRISGFYKIVERAPGNLLLLACACGDPDLAVIGSTATCGLFHRPWDLVWEGTIPWPDAHIKDAQDRWVKKIEAGDSDYVHGITSNSYPELFARFPPMSAHQKILIENWRAVTTRLIKNVQEKQCS